MRINNKQRYEFALSAFSRMYGFLKIDSSMKQFCLEWSEKSVTAPLSSLDEVDQYFHYEYKNWRGI
jgi:hypothetical protein